MQPQNQMEKPVTQLDVALESPETLERKILLAKPIIGFGEDVRYALRGMPPRYAPYLLLDALRDGGPQFVVVPPGLLFPDYVIEIPEADAELLGLESAFDVEVLTLVTSHAGQVPTVNLLGPIVINWTTGIAAQVVLADSPYGVAVPVTAASAGA